MAEEKLKPYFVEVELRVRVPVVAKSEEDACAVGRDHAEEEINNGYFEDAITFASAVPITPGMDGQDFLAYGVDDDHPRRDWPIKKWLEADAE